MSAANQGVTRGAAKAGGRGGGGEPLLTSRALSVRYGGVQAVEGANIDVHEGELVTVIGANGAGKSSFVNAVVGAVPVAGGSVSFNGHEITGAAPEELVAKGIVLVPERRELFAALSVEDNLRLGAYARRRGGRRAINEQLARVYGTFPRLLERRRQLAGTMSGGEQQMLAMGRAMMARPALLLLDEPSLGLAPLIVQEIFRVIEELRAAGSTVLLIEQNARMALRLADHAYLLEAGVVTLSAPAAEMAADERVARAYLGVGEGA